MRLACKTNSSPFPPRTREAQLDEKWAFVAKKQKNCDPADPADDHKGDWWDHVAYDPEHKLVLAVVPGARSGETAREVVGEVVEDGLGLVVGHAAVEQRGALALGEAGLAGVARE